MQGGRLVAALALVAACGGSSPAAPLATSRQAIIGGGADAVHDSVVSIVAHVDASAPELCSGTVIAPRVVLTAGHCTLGQDPAGLVVGVGPSASAPTRVLAVAGVVTFPRYRGVDDLPGGTDLGAILLAEDAGLPSVPLLAGDAGALLGGPVTVVGYGQSSASDLESSGTRRAAVTSVSAVCSAMLSFGDATTNACHGDSGGPLLLAGDAGGESLAAVVSYGDELHCATASRAVRVDRYASWIADVLAGVASSDGGACADCPPAAADCEGDAGSDGEAGGDGPVDAPASAADAGVSRGLRVAGGCGVARGGSGAGEAGLPVIAMVLVIVFRLGSARSCAESSFRSRSRSSSSSPARASPGRTAPTRPAAAATRPRTSSA